MLVITIIVVIVLATAVIVSLVQSNPIQNAKEAEFKNSMKAFEYSLQAYYTKKLADNPNMNVNNMNAVRNPSAMDEDILEILPQAKGKYENKVESRAARLIYTGEDKLEKKWSCEIGIALSSGICDEEDTVVTIGGVSHYAPNLIGFNKYKTSYVTYSDTGEMTKTPLTGSEPKTGSGEPSWYNYKEKKWANIVVENEGKTLHLVWIPRYEYKINNPGAGVGKEEVIQVNFSTNLEKSSTDGYILHPSFSLDFEEGKKKQLSGIWVSKYDAQGVSLIQNVEIYPASGAGNIKVVATPGAGNNIVANSYEYEIYNLLGQKVGNTVTDISTTTISGLEPNQTYTIKVKAKDAEGIYTSTYSKSFTTVRANNIPNEPDLTGFNRKCTYYLTYSNTGVETRTLVEGNTPPAGWYDYNAQKWANIVVDNNGKQLYLVWIPRYEYRIKNPGAGVTKEEVIDINFINTSVTTATNGFKLHPAFTLDMGGGTIKILSGIWVSKYDAQNAM